MATAHDTFKSGLFSWTMKVPPLTREIYLIYVGIITRARENVLQTCDRGVVTVRPLPGLSGIIIR